MEWTNEDRNIWEDKLRYLSEEEVQKKINENKEQFKDYVWTTLRDNNK